MYIVAAILRNALTCMQPNNTSKFFELEPPTVEEYFFNDDIYIIRFEILTLIYCYFLRRPFKNIKLVGNQRKGLRTNFPGWRKPQAKLYLYIILPEQHYY